MALKRKTRNLPEINDQMSFFDPVYPNNDIQISDDENENDLLADGIPRPSFGKGNINESNETLGTNTITNNDQEQSSELISTSKIIGRIKQIQNSIQQARTMLESMEQFKHLVPGTDEQRQKLYSIISNLEEQHESYANLLNLISLTEQERSAILNQNSTYNEDDNDDNDLSLRRNVQSPVRPRIESKIGFIVPQATKSAVPPLTNSSDNEQTTRNDNSNYDSLVGSLKSDTITWKDQQSTSDDEISDGEMEKNLMLQKEQLRALQGQKRALLALKRRSEKHLIEQQQLSSKKPTSLNQTNEENDLLSDINNLRDRLKTLRNLYQQKHQVELHRLQNSSIPTESRLKNLEHIRERLDELEQLVTYFQTDITNQEDEEITTYAETSIQPDDTQRLQTLIQQTENNDNAPKQLDKLSSELTAKRLELEQAKSALSQLQQMVKTIQPEECSSSARSSPTPRKSSPKNNEFELRTTQYVDTPGSADAKMTAQHREITRLVESRQRLHNIKDQIASLHQSMTTPLTQSKNDLNNETKTYEDKLNDSRNIRPAYQFDRQENASQEDNQSELYAFEDESEDGEETDDDTASQIQTQPRMKQSNLYASDTIVGKSSDDLNTQMREICRCLSTFIEEQKSFNRHIEQRLTTAATNPSVSQPTDPMFNQLQQQVLTQGLIVNLNTAYREIAVLQSEINALQSENNRLSSSISFDNQYHHRIPHSYSRDNSKESNYNFDQIKPNIRPQPRSRFDEQLKQQNDFFENSSKTSVNSQSTGKQTAVRVEKLQMETTPIKQISDTYDLPNHHRHSSKENLSNSFIIRRRTITTENENHYKEKVNQQRTFDESDDEQQANDFSPTVFNIQPSAYYTSTTHNLDNVDIQTLDLQVKSIMVQLIPYMRLHINEIFNQSILNHIRERILFLFKQQPDSAQLIRHFQNQFSQSLGKTIEKYCGTTIRECAADLIRDISDLAFNELVKYKIYENTTSEQSAFDDGENENKYQIELLESENRPLTLIGSDEEDNDSDQEENKISDLETAVSRQEINLHENQSTISTEFNSNGHEYILVNRSINNHIVPKNEEENEN